MLAESKSDRRHGFQHIAALVAVLAAAMGATLGQEQPLFHLLWILPTVLTFIFLLHGFNLVVWFLIPLAWVRHGSLTLMFCLLICCTLIVLHQFFLKQTSPDIPHKRMLLALIVYSIVVTAYHGVSGAVIGQWIWDFGIILLFVFLASLRLPRVSIRPILIWILCCTAVGALTVIFQGLSHPDIRATGIVDKVSTGVAYNLSMFTPLALGLIYGARSKAGVLLLSMIPIAAIYYTGSRAPFVFVLFFSLPFIIEYRGAMLSLGMAFIGSLFIAGGGLVSRVETFQSGNVIFEASTYMRLIIWGVAIESIIQNPLLGIGLGNFHALAQSRIPIEALVLGQPHNSVLNKSVQIGVPGMVFFHFCVAAILLTNFKSWLELTKSPDLSRGDQAMLKGLMLAPFPLIACALTDSVFNGYAQPFLIWTMLALQVVAFRSFREQT